MEYLYQLITQDKKDFASLLLRIFLRGCSFIYYLCIRFILWAYKVGVFPRYRLDCVVISVGNITSGGTGKTPLVEMLARRLSTEGYKVAILSRGYRMVHRSPFTVHRKKKFYGQRTTENGQQKMGDEAFLLKENLPHVPVLVGKNRVATGRKATEEYKVDTIILDDGFQYWRLSRNLDIVTINSSCPFGNAQVLPRGILREPLSSLRRADIFILTKTDLERGNLLNLKDRLRQINPQALVVESVHQPMYLYGFRGERTELGELKGRRICLVSSIADPASFEKTVLSLDAEIGLKFPFPDHYDYRLEDIKRILNACMERNIRTIITTEKDAVRLSTFRVQSLELGIQTFILRIEIRIVKNEREFFDRFYRKVLQDS